MVYTLVISISAIILMFLCILKFPILRIKNITIDTFFMPLLFAAILLLLLPGFDRNQFFQSLISSSDINPLKILIFFIIYCSVLILIYLFVLNYQIIIPKVCNKFRDFCIHRKIPIGNFIY